MEKTHIRMAGVRTAAVIIILALSLVACQTATPVESTATAEPTEIVVVPTELPTVAPVVLEGATVTGSGLQFLEITTGSGKLPNKGDIITMQYIVTLPDGSELANTYTQSEPATAVWGLDRLLPGWEEGIGMMNVGSKARIVIPPDLAFGEQGSGPIPPNSQLIIEMELLSSAAAPSPVQVAEDSLTTTASGLQYYDIVKGSGPQAVADSNVSTHFTVWVKTDTGNIFVDQSGSQGPVNFVVGRGDVVFPGWEEGVTGMNVGGKRLLVIPPALAMGDQGNGLIPANATLVMEIELVDLREPQVATKVDEKDFTTTESGLKYYDLVEGTGPTPTAGQMVIVHYTGWLEDGTQFDSSLEAGQPLTFNLGMGNVIPGWDEGVATMKVGGKRQLVIPAALAYGDSGSGGVIPPGATLIFEVELLEIQ